MLLNQLPKVKNPSEYNSVLVSKQLDKLQSVINGRVEGFFFFFFSLSLLICILILLIAGQHEYTASTAVRSHIK